MSNISDAVEDASELDNQLECLRSLIVECKELRQLELKLRNFNIFEVLRLEHHEIRHSNILAWLFDPSESHGFRELFIRRWLMRVFHDSESETASYLDPVDIDATPFRSVIVYREWLDIDLLIEITTQDNEVWVVCIENKIKSSLHSNQLFRYRDHVTSQYPDAKRLFVLLSVMEIEPDDDNYAVATYSQVRTILSDLLKEQGNTIGAEPKILLTHYLSCVEDHFMPDSEVKQLANKIYAAHKKAIDLIFECRTDTLELQQLLTDSIVEEFKKREKNLTIFFHRSINGVIYLVPEVWKRNDPLPVWVEVHFYGMKNLMFKGMLGGADSKWRLELFEMSKKLSFQNTQNRKVLPDKFFQFYGVKNTSIELNLPENADVSKKAVEIVDWCAANITSKEFLKVLTSVAEHLKSHN